MPAPRIDLRRGVRSATDGFYPSWHRIEDLYAKRWGTTVVQQMVAAAQRLAAAVNQGLAVR